MGIAIKFFTYKIIWFDLRFSQWLWKQDFSEGIGLAVIFIVEGLRMECKNHRINTLLGLEIRNIRATSYDNLSRRLDVIVRLDRHRQNAERSSLKLSTLFTWTLIDPTKHSNTFNTDDAEVKWSILKVLLNNEVFFHLTIFRKSSTLIYISW